MRKGLLGREPDIALNRLAHQTIGAAIEVHRALGPGYLESVYGNALAVELAARAISFEREYPFEIIYKGSAVGSGRLDFLLESRLVVEAKTVEQFAPIHKAQVLSYLKATRLQLALLINFNVPTLKTGINRIVLTV